MFSGSCGVCGSVVVCGGWWLGAQHSLTCMAAARLALWHMRPGLAPLCLCPALNLCVGGVTA